jgi:UDPglucose 6-dehydrogenase
MKITFINEVANLCEKVGANVQDVAKAMGRDGRIGSKFLHPGPGYGGSCFPKDTLALAKIGKNYDSPVSLVEATISANERQKLIMVKKIESKIGNPDGKVLAILGLAFKQNTNDMREAPSIAIVNALASRGASFRVYDPVAVEEAKAAFEHIGDRIVYCSNEYEAMTNADAVVIVTEWNQFRNLDLEKARGLLKQPYFFDLRNLYKRNILEKSGFVYDAVGQ